MSNYFKTGNATRKFKKAGMVFEFEPLIFQSGTWLGALEEPKEERAKVLAEFGAPIFEITKEEFDELKKKPKTSLATSASSLPTVEETAKKDAPPAVENLADELKFKAPPADEGSPAPAVKKAVKKAAKES